ncbi:hypothetical protein ETB97_000475 [Aspergillus alliaceus]|uniref:Uncharacterized protein n=1 Tax=Petromyces alliaceus TaxID=209559 RepID=A0A8H6A617_PETAA|nr:hypothetical protein ETB97_000475 [Aspergillus burnettii]
MVTTCIVLLYMSYLVPIVCLCKGREIIPHGPFWLRKLGLVRNWIVLAWTLFCLVIYSFPASINDAKPDMNYASVVYAVVATDGRTPGSSERTIQS